MANDIYKPFRFTVNLPRILEPLVKARRLQEGYKSDSKFGAGLVLYDLMTRRKHSITAEIMRKPDWVIYKAAEQIVEDFKNNVRHGRAAEPSFFQRELEKFVREHADEVNGETAPKPKPEKKPKPKKPKKDPGNETD